MNKNREGMQVVGYYISSETTFVQYVMLLILKFWKKIVKLESSRGNKEDRYFVAKSPSSDEVLFIILRQERRTLLTKSIIRVGLLYQSVRI